jgi:ABC-type multidrug transport system fused ATPase/permease subunit
MDRLEFAIENFKNIQELIRFIDQKAGALLVIYGFILTAFVDFAKKLEFVNPLKHKEFFPFFHSILTFAVGVILIWLLLYKIYILVYKVIRPRVARNYVDGKLSFYYYDHITQMDKEVYKQKFHKLSEEQLIEEVLDQVYEVSLIMIHKSINLNKVINSFFTTIVLLLLYILLVETI